MALQELCSFQSSGQIDLSHGHVLIHSANAWRAVGVVIHACWVSNVSHHVNGSCFGLVILNFEGFTAILGSVHLPNANHGYIAFQCAIDELTDALRAIPDKDFA